MKALWTGQYRYISPKDFKVTIGKINDQFAGSSQQDSQELLLFLMDGLHEDLNKVRMGSPKLPLLPLRRSLKPIHHRSFFRDYDCTKCASAELPRTNQNVCTYRMKHVRTGSLVST